MASPRHLLTSIRARIHDIVARLRSFVSIKALPFILIGVTIALGTIGGVQQYFDGTAASFLSILFKSLENLTPNFKNLASGNGFTEAAAFTGIVNLYLSAILIAANTLRESRRKFTARWFLRNHVLVIGDSGLARRAVSLWSKRNARLLHVIPRDKQDAPEWGSHAIRLPFDRSLAAATAISRARNVFIDLGTSISSLGLACELATALDEIGAARDRPPAQWTVISRDISLADHFVRRLADMRSGPGGQGTVPDVYFLDPEVLTARYQTASHPPFLIAERLGHQRIHVLIAGFEAYGAALLEAVILSSLTTKLNSPVFTVLCDESEKQKRTFFSGRTALTGEVDLVFLETGVLDAFQDATTGEARIARARDEADPVTIVYLSSPSSEENIRLGFKIETIRQRLGRLQCPVFALEDDYLSAGFLTAGGSFGPLLKDFSVFNLPDDLLERHVCDSDARDRLAKAFHGQYASTKASSPSSAPWDRLPESFRRANRNAADHWRATMDILGFDVEGIPPGIVPRLDEQDAREISASILREPAPIEGPAFWDAVCAEHERWVLERKLDGWIAGSVRDDARQTNPLLVSWPVLLRDHASAAAKAADQVKALLDYLAAHGDTDFPLRRKGLNAIENSAQTVLLPVKPITV
jgi:hypothetical protein